MSAETQFEIIKRRLLDIKPVAVVVIGFVVITGFATLAGSLYGLRGLMVFLGRAPAGSSPTTALPDPAPINILRTGPGDPLKDGLGGPLFVIDDVADKFEAEEVPNSDHTGLDAREIRADRQGAYAYHFTDAQAKRANERGWELHSQMKAEQGAAFASVEFGEPYRRWDVWVYHRNGRTFVGLPGASDLNVGVSFSKEYPLPNGGNDYVDVKLVFDHQLKTAELFINGRSQQANYQGWLQSNDRKAGLVYGTYAYPRSAKAVADFKLIGFNSP